MILQDRRYRKHGLSRKPSLHFAVQDKSVYEKEECDFTKEIKKKFLTKRDVEEIRWCVKI